MLKEFLNAIAREINKEPKVVIKRHSNVELKILQIVEEIEELEKKYVKALADAERWGDLTNSSDWRTVEVNKYKRLIDSKKGMIEMLNSHV